MSKEILAKPLEGRTEAVKVPVTKCRAFLAAAPLLVAFAVPTLLGVGCKQEAGKAIDNKIPSAFTDSAFTESNKAKAEFRRKLAELAQAERKVEKADEEAAAVQSKLDRVNKEVAAADKEIAAAEKEIRCLKSPKACVRKMKAQIARLNAEIKRQEKETAQLRTTTAQVDAEKAELEKTLEIAQRVEVKMQEYSRYVSWMNDVADETEYVGGNPKKEVAARHMAWICQQFVSKVLGEKYDEWSVAEGEKKAIIFADALTSNAGEWYLDRTLDTLYRVMLSYKVQV